MAKLNELPVKALGVMLGLALLVSVGLYFLVYKSVDDQNREARLKVQAKTAENASLRPYEAKLPELNRTIDALQLQLANLQRIVPDEKEADQFMHMMQTEARQAGIEIRRYTAKPTTSKEFYTEVPFDIDLDGPYYSVLNFFERISKLERIINIGNVQVGAIKDGDIKTQKTYKYGPRESVVTTCTATTFFSHDASSGAPNGAKR